MKKITFAIGHRAESGLTWPIRKRLLKEKGIAMHELHVEGMGFGEAYSKAYCYFIKIKPDLAFIPCDRPEILGVALAAFFENVPIAHYGAGDIEEDAVHSGDIRHMISQIADLIFVKGKDRKDRLIKRGIDGKRIFIVNSTAFDDLEINDYWSKVYGNKKYDLILYHPISKHLDKMDDELKEIGSLVKQNDKDDILSIWLKPNGDPGSDKIVSFVKKMKHLPQDYDRPAFMGLMKNCRRIIGNSSCLIYEAPYFLKHHQIVHIGIRNKGRDRVVIKPGGSDQIVDILREWNNER